MALLFEIASEQAGSNVQLGLCERKPRDDVSNPDAPIDAASGET